MEITFTTSALSAVEADTLAVLVPQYEKLTDPRLKALDKASHGRLQSLLKAGEFSGREGQIARFHGIDGYGAANVVVAGLGPKPGVTPDSYRRACGLLSRHPSLTKYPSAAMFLGPSGDAGLYEAAVEGLILGSFRILDYRCEETPPSGKLPAHLAFVLDNKRSVARLQKAVERGRLLAEGQCRVRRLAATPANLLTPRDMARSAQRLARGHPKMSCRIMDETGIRRERMGALMAVAQGSEQPPRFVVLEYRGGRPKQRPVVLVGKGMTYDSGGLSLKKADTMPEMKGDMTGAAVVMTAIECAAQLNLPLNVVALMPLAENMPSSKAYRPGDIVTSRKGLTIEVMNTDAEGRLILADALDYANEFEPQAVIDIATLTGGALYVLGYSGAPIMGNHPKLMDRLRAASAATSERVWEMPIWDDFRGRMKSPLADLQNSGGKAAATMTAAAFLESFIGDWPWAHVDIAYVDLEPKGRPYIPKGNTGIGLRLLVQMLIDWKKL